jgi:hypothetical protein
VSLFAFCGVPFLPLNITYCKDITFLYNKTGSRPD